jgi:hypothetical protein
MTLTATGSSTLGEEKNLIFFPKDFEVKKKVD